MGRPIKPVFTRRMLLAPLPTRFTTSLSRLTVLPRFPSFFFFSAWTLNFKPFSLRARSRFLVLISRAMMCVYLSFSFFLKNLKTEKEKLFVKFLEKKFFFRFFHLVWMEISNKLAYRLCIYIYKLVYTDEDGSKFYLREISLTLNSIVLE